MESLDDAAIAGATDPDALALRYELERRRAERLTLIGHIGRLIASHLRLDDLLQGAADAIHVHLKFASVAIPLTDPDRPEMMELRYVGGLYQRLLPANFRFPITLGIIGVAARTHQVVRVDDVTTDPRYQPIPSAVGIQAELAVPILLGEHLLGVLNVESERPLTDDDGPSLQAIADYLAVAIDNARLFAAVQARADRILLISRSSRLMTGRLDLNQLLATAVAIVGQHVASANVAVLLLDPDDPSTLQLRARSGVYAEPAVGDYRQSINVGIIGVAARTQQPQFIPDIRCDPRYLAVPGGESFQSELAVPLVVGDALLGVLNVESERELQPEDVEGLLIVGEQLSVAVHNALLFDDSRRLLAESRLLADTSQRIGRAMDVDGVITSYLRQVAAGGRYVCTVVQYEFDEMGRRVGVLIWGRWSPDEGLVVLQEAGAVWPRDELDPLLDAGQVVLIADVRTDPRVSDELRRLQEQEGRPALVMIPLLARHQRIGLIVLSNDRVGAWREADVQPYQVTAAQLAAAIDSRRQYQLLAERGQRLAVLEDRRRLARELHDSVTQHLFSTTLVAQSIRPIVRSDPDEVERRLERLVALSRTALAEMRALLFELRPPAGATPTGDDAMLLTLARVRRDGLVAALGAHLASLADSDVQVSLTTAGYARQPVEHEEALYRIAQEALANTIKHAHASRVSISLTTVGQAVCLTITDDGVGFVSEAAPESLGTGGGLGLSSMRERAAALGGEVIVVAAPGQGVTVATTLPTGAGG